MRQLTSLLFSTCFFTHYLSALPKELLSGKCTISEEKGKMVISSEDGACLKWKAFNIETDETLQFSLPSQKSCVINQVMEHNPSYLMGSLLSNGRVFLLNPAGILIGKEAKIDTAAFIISTFDHIERSSKDALGWKIGGKGGGKISIEGSITAQKGPIVVIGENIDCPGTVQAMNGSAYLLGSDECFIGDDDGILWTDYLPAGSALSLQGKVFARSEAVALSESVALGEKSVVHAPSGMIAIGGKSNAVLLEEGSLLDVSGQEDQHGGKVLVNSQGSTHAFGHIKAQGGPLGGDGGSIEVSGSFLNFRGTVDTTAAQGNIGHLLLDPLSIRIGGGADTNVTGASPYTPTASPSIISTATLNGALALANVTVQSSGAAGPDAGNIFLVDNYITGSPAGTTLTLLSFNNIEINAALSFTSAGSIVLDAPNGSVLIGNAPTIPAQTLPAVLSTATGDITISALNDVIVQANSGGGFPASISAPGRTISITTNSGNVQVLAGSAAGTFAQIGSLVAPATSNIIINSGNNVTVSAGTGANSMATIGNGTFAPASPGTLTGDISITAAGNVNVLGGSGSNSYGLIGFKNGDLANAVNVDGAVTVRSGRGVNVLSGVDARGDGIIGLLTYDWLPETWDISIDVETNGPFNLLANSGDASAAIGIVNDITTPVPPATLNAPLIRVVSHSPAPCQLTGSTSVISGRAVIGFEQTGSIASGNLPNITVQTQGNLQFNPGFGSLIGFTSDLIPNLLGNVTVSVGGDFVMSGASSYVVAATTAVSPGSDNNTVSVSAANILATALDGVGAGFASAGPLNISVINDFQIETINPATIGIVQGLRTVTVNVGNDIICSSAGLAPLGSIYFGYIPLGIGPIFIQAGRDIIFNGPSGGAGFSTAVVDVAMQSTGIDIVAGRNVFLGEHAAVVSAVTSPINIVCDNQFPTTPQIGPGRLDTSASSFIGMLGKGEIRLFTAQQDQNTILGQFQNGGSTATGLALGPLFADIPPEKWGIYYFNSFYYTNSVFTIFYKPIFQQISEPANLVVSELVYTFNDFDQYFEWPELWRDSARFNLLYNHTSTKMGDLSLKFSPDEYYWIARRKSRFLHYPNQRRL